MSLWLAKLVAKIEAISLRERVMIFAAIAVALVAMMHSFLIEPLLEKQKKLSLEVREQHMHLKELQLNLEALTQKKQAIANSPLHEQIRLSKQKIKDDEEYIKKRRDTLVPPDQVGALLEQVLSQNGRLQLVSLDTLEAKPMDEPVAGKTSRTGAEKVIYKHGVKIVVRGSYNDLLAYLSALEKLPTQMSWGDAKMTVLQHPTIELALTLYTFSLDTTWLQI